VLIASLAQLLTVTHIHIWNTTKQQMQGSKRGAHLVLQTRVKTLHRKLGPVLKRWYPDREVEELPEAA